MDRRNFLAGLAIAPMAGLAALKFPKPTSNYSTSCWPIDNSKWMKDSKPLTEQTPIWTDIQTGEHFDYELIDDKYVKISTKGKVTYMTLGRYNLEIAEAAKRLGENAAYTHNMMWENLRNP